MEWYLVGSLPSSSLAFPAVAAGCTLQERKASGARWRENAREIQASQAVISSLRGLSLQDILWSKLCVVSSNTDQSDIPH